MFWRRTRVYWKTTMPRLLGVRQAGSSPVNFTAQAGVYVLYDGSRPIYVGKVTGPRVGQVSVARGAKWCQVVAPGRIRISRAPEIGHVRRHAKRGLYQAVRPFAPFAALADAGAYRGRSHEDRTTQGRGTMIRKILQTAAIAGLTVLTLFASTAEAHADCVMHVRHCIPMGGGRGSGVFCSETDTPCPPYQPSWQHRAQNGG